MSDELLTIRQVAERFGVTRQAVGYWIKRGLLPGYRPQAPEGVKSPWLVRQSEVDSFTPPRKGRV